MQRYEGISFAETHGSILHLIPPAPCHVLDIGAGTGRDAAGFAALGTGLSLSSRPPNCGRARWPALVATDRMG